MIASSGRAHLLELYRQRDLARIGRDLLDQKREAMLRAINDRLPRVRRLRAELADALAAARTSIADASCELGLVAVASASLAQPPYDGLTANEETVLGVMIPIIACEPQRFAPQYGPATASTRLDRAGTAYAALLPVVVDLGREDAALRRLRRALTRTVRRLNALDTIVLPDVTAAIATAAAALEEDERDEAVRHTRWAALGNPQQPALSPKLRHRGSYASDQTNSVSR